MKDDLAQAFLDKASQLEILVADLYTLFEKSFPEDSKFWHQLAQEEKNHAELFININPNWSNKFVSSFAPGLLQEIQGFKEWLSPLIIKFSDKKTDRKTAFNTAIKIEKSAGEIDYQNFMNKETDSWILKGLQHINEYERDHLNRLEQYIEENKII